MKDIRIFEGFLIGLAGGFVAAFFVTKGSTQIRSSKKLQPQIELITMDNTVDTIYIYKKK